MKRLMIRQEKKERAMSALARRGRGASSASTGRTPPRQPDYPDEISSEQLEAIRKMTDPDGKRAEKRTELYSPAW